MRRRKYGNKPVEMDGIKFASKKERNKYAELVILERGGLISDLKPHPKFELNALGGGKVGVYTADASYIENGCLVVLDIKSPSTAKETSYRMRFRHMQQQYGITIKEVF